MKRVGHSVRPGRVGFFPSRLLGIRAAKGAERTAKAGEPRRCSAPLASEHEACFKNTARLVRALGRRFRTRHQASYWLREQSRSLPEGKTRLCDRSASR